jgi:hypothetical protein
LGGGTVFFLGNIFFTEGRRKIRLPQNLVNLGIFLIEIFQTKFEFKTFCAQINKIRPQFDSTFSSRRSAKSFHGTNHWSQAQIRLPAPLPIFAAKITKSEQKIDSTRELELTNTRQIIPVRIGTTTP